MICPAITPFKARKYARKIIKQERILRHMLLFFSQTLKHSNDFYCVHMFNFILPKYVTNWMPNETEAHETFSTNYSQLLTWCSSTRSTKPA
jgi:hypothetical protein